MERGIQPPMPEYVSRVIDAQYWGVSPMELETWPIYWIQAGQIVRAAQNQAQQASQETTS